MEPIDKEKQESETFRVRADTAPMGLSLNLTIGLPATNFGTGAGVSNGSFGSFDRGERSLAANNAINAGAGTDFWLVLAYPPFSTARVSNEGRVDTASDLNLELTLSSINYDAANDRGSGAGDRGTGAANDAFSDNLSALKKLTSTYKGVRRRSNIQSTSSGEENQCPRRKKADKWSIEEHYRFLEGLSEVRKGQWKLIADKYVLTRTSTQVASHAQKYFQKQQLKEQTNKKQRAGLHILKISELPPDYVPVSDCKHKEACFADNSTSENQYGVRTEALRHCGVAPECNKIRSQLFNIN